MAGCNSSLPERNPLPDNVPGIQEAEAFISSYETDRGFLNLQIPVNPARPNRNNHTAVGSGTPPEATIRDAIADGGVTP